MLSRRFIPFYPLFRFLRIIIVHGGLSARGVLRLSPWILKFVLFEPLRLIELILFERKILKTKITQSPVFILGHYRSGTTFTQRIFSIDSRFGTMTAFQQVAPDLMLIFEKPLTIVLQFICRLLRIQNHFHRLPYDWKLPGEEDLGLMSTGSPVSASWGFIFPDRYQKIFSDQLNHPSKETNDAWQEEYLYLLKKLTLKNHGKQLVLKSPPNTARVEQLIRLFPGARFIYISRDRYELFSSMRNLWRVVRRFHTLGHIQEASLHESISFSILLFQKKWADSKSLIPQDHMVEIDYADLVHNPAHVTEAIYSRLSLPDYAEKRITFESFFKSQKNYSRLEHHITENERKAIDLRMGTLSLPFIPTSE